MGCIWATFAGKSGRFQFLLHKIQIGRNWRLCPPPLLLISQILFFFFLYPLWKSFPCCSHLSGNCKRKKKWNISPNLSPGVHVFLLLVFCFCLRRWASISCLKTSIPSCPWEASFMAFDCMHILYCSGVSSSTQRFSCQRWKSPRTGVRTTMRLLCRYLR